MCPLYVTGQYVSFEAGRCDDHPDLAAHLDRRLAELQVRLVTLTPRHSTTTTITLATALATKTNASAFDHRA